MGILPLEAPRFSGSLSGGLLGISAALLMVLAFAYLVLKRLRGRVFGLRQTRASRLLQLHVGFGLAAGTLALVHTGNLVRSPIGLGLILTLIGILATGLVGRYQLRRLSDELQENEEDLLTLRGHLETADLRRHLPEANASRPAKEVVSAIADVEAAQQLRGALQAGFRGWTIVHLLLSIALLAILALHIVSNVYLGLRWWP